MQTNSFARTLALAFVACVLAAGAAAAASGVVNINTASGAQLTLLPRVGDTIAGRIIEYREANGSFDSLEALMHVPGIGEKTFEMLKPYITVKGDTTLGEKVRESETASGG